MIPSWLHWVSVASLVLAMLSALIIAGDIAVGRRQKMMVMNFVWPLTGLYFGPLALWAYFTLGRNNQMNGMEGDMEHQGHEMPGHQMKGDGKPEEKMAMNGDKNKPQKSFWQTTFVGTTHCGAGCTLGDFAGEWAVFLFGWTLAGLALWASYLADFVFAFLLGIVFQYFSIVPMRHLNPKQGIWAALKADTLSITAFEVGMFAWMALSRFLIIGHETKPVQPVYWFLMQIAMLVGFATSYPMNWWLIRKGWKEAM